MTNLWYPGIKESPVQGLIGAGGGVGSNLSSGGVVRPPDDGDRAGKTGATYFWDLGEIASGTGGDGGIVDEEKGNANRDLATYARSTTMNFEVNPVPLTGILSPPGIYNVAELGKSATFITSDNDNRQGINCSGDFQVAYFGYLTSAINYTYQPWEQKYVTNFNGGFPDNSLDTRTYSTFVMFWEAGAEYSRWDYCAADYQSRIAEATSATDIRPEPNVWFYHKSGRDGNDFKQEVLTWDGSSWSNSHSGQGGGAVTTSMSATTAGVVGNATAQSFSLFSAFHSGRGMAGYAACASYYSGSYPSGVPSD